MNYQQYIARSYITELDGIRGLAVLMVVACHVKGKFFLHLSGHYGVTMFFVLSGFLITTLGLREEIKNGKVGLAGFYIRRSCRIFPLYFAVLSLYAVCLLVLHIKDDHEQVFRQYWMAYVFYYQEFVKEWTDHKMPFGQSWTLGIEEKFYLVWPTLCFGLCRFETNRVRLGVAIASTLSIALIAPLLTVTDHAVLGHCLEPYAGILMGCILALVLNNRMVFEWMQQYCGPASCIAMTCIVLSTQLTAAWAASRGLEKVWHWFYIVSSTLWIASLLVSNGFISKVLRNAALTFVGRLSYGIYLIHVIALFPAHRVASHVSHEALSAMLAFAIAASVSIIVSYVLSVTIEQPCIRFGRRYAESLRVAA